MKSASDYNQIIEDYNSVFVEAFEKTSRANMVSTISVSETIRVLKVIQRATSDLLNSKGIPVVQLSRPGGAIAVLQSGVIQNPTVILNRVNHMIDTTSLSVKKQNCREL